MAELFTFGTPSAVEALVSAIEQEGIPIHSFTGCENCCQSMVNALETAFFAGWDWGTNFTGIPIQDSAQWADRLARVELTRNQLIGLIYALRAAMELGDEFAGSWLSDLASQYEMEWV